MGLSVPRDPLLKVFFCDISFFMHQIPSIHSQFVLVSLRLRDYDACTVLV
jgi:hypothetical protein